MRSDERKGVWLIFFEEDFMWMYKKFDSVFNRDMKWCCEFDWDENRG